MMEEENLNNQEMNDLIQNSRKKWKGEWEKFSNLQELSLEEYLKRNPNKEDQFLKLLEFKTTDERNTKLKSTFLEQIKGHINFSFRLGALVSFCLSLVVFYFLLGPRVSGIKIEKIYGEEVYRDTGYSNSALKVEDRIFDKTHLLLGKGTIVRLKLNESSTFMLKGPATLGFIVNENDLELELLSGNFYYDSKDSSSGKISFKSNLASYKPLGTKAQWKIFEDKDKLILLEGKFSIKLMNSNTEIELKEKNEINLNQKESIETKINPINKFQLNEMEMELNELTDKLDPPKKKSGNFKGIYGTIQSIYTKDGKKIIGYLYRNGNTISVKTPNGTIQLDENEILKIE